VTGRGSGTSFVPIPLGVCPVWRILCLPGLGSFHLVPFSPTPFVGCFVLLMIGRLIPGDKLEKLNGENLDPHSWPYQKKKKKSRYLPPILGLGFWG